MEKKTMTIKEVKELIQDIIDFVGGTDSQIDEYLKELKRSL